MARAKSNDLLLLAGFALDGGRLTLRQALPEDWIEWSTLRSESRAHLTPWEALWPADALSETVYARRMRRSQGEWREDEAYAFHIFSRDPRRLVGGISLSQVKRGIAQSAVLGYWIGQRYTRQGFAKEATRMILDLAFTRLGLHRIEAACLPDNIASRKVLEKLGFREEGFAHSYLKIAGEWADHLLYGIVEDEWRGQILGGSKAFL